MHRFYLEPEKWFEESLVLEGAEAKHCREVLRLGEGDSIVLFDGRGNEATVTIADASKNRITTKIRTRQQTPRLAAEITLAQAVPKGKNMDLIVQKAVELGASRIVPLLSDRTVVQLDPKEVAKKQGKWQGVAIEACKQCGQNWLPEVGEPQSAKSFLSGQGRGSELRLIASLQPDTKHLKQVLRDYEESRGIRPSHATVLVGPEGDFTPAELGLARTEGFAPITLGPIILRAETAALYCLSVLNYELLSGEA